MFGARMRVWGHVTRRQEVFCDLEAGRARPGSPHVEPCLGRGHRVIGLMTAHGHKADVLKASPDVRFWA